MKDVNYIVSDQTRDALNKLMGSGWTDGMIGALKILSNNLEDVESDIRKYAVDGLFLSNIRVKQISTTLFLKTLIANAAIAYEECIKVLIVSMKQEGETINLSQVARLIRNFHLPIIETDTSIAEEESFQAAGYKEIRLHNGEWEFVIFPERYKDEKVLKTFKDERSASKYFYLVMLNSYFANNYIYPFESDNKDINVGGPNFTLNNLKVAFHRLKMDEKYYSFNAEVKEHSVYLHRINKLGSTVKFFGDNLKLVFETMELENWMAYSVIYQYVYTIYLLDAHCQSLIEQGEISQRFTDEEYDVVMS